MPQKEADQIALNLIKIWLKHCLNLSNISTQKSIQAINDELKCLESNSDENQEMVDTRLSVIFQEIANLIENHGELLFIKSKKN